MLVLKSSNTADISYYAPEFFIEINGNELSADVSKVIKSLSVDQSLDKTNSFNFEVQDEFFVGANGGQKRPFRWLGHDLFKYGNDVSVLMGYVNNKQKMVEGKIQNISANFFQSTAPTFKVDGADNAYEFLMNKSKTDVFKEKTHSEMVEKIAQMNEVNLNAVVDKTQLEFSTKIKKGGVSYFDFLKEISKSEAFKFYLSGRELFFIDPKGEKAKKEKEGIKTLKWGEELISFKPTLKTAQATTLVVVRSWDRKGKKMIEAKVPAGEETKQEDGKKLASQVAREIYGEVEKVITDQPVRTMEEARKIALSELEKSSDKFIKASVETIGIPELKPAVCINIEGLGNWFSGKYYIEKVTHRIDNNGYRTTFEAHRNSV